MTGNISFFGWLILAAGLLMLLGSLKSFLSASRRQQASSVASIKLRKPLTDPYRALYWRCREAVPDLIVLGALPFDALFQMSVSKKRRRNSRINELLPLVILSRECFPQLALFIVDPEDSSNDLEQQFRILEELQLPVLKLKHPYVSREELSDAIRKAETLALQRSGSKGSPPDLASSKLARR